MAAPSSAIAAFQIPDWAVTNNKAFQSLPPGCTDRKRQSFVQVPAMLDLCLQSARAAGYDVQSAVTMASQSDEPSGGIFPPPAGVTPSQSYFTDVRNHPDIMTTIINTARVTAGFTATPVQNNLDAQQQLDQFNKFIQVLDTYGAYINLERFGTRKVQDKTNDCNRILDAVVSVIDNAMGGGSIAEAAKTTIKETIQQAAKFVTSGVGDTEFIDTSYQHINLTPSTGIILASTNPRGAICYTTTRMEARDDKHGGRPGESEVDIVALTYQLSSSAIIDYADHLSSSGTTITGGQQFVDLINAPLKSLT